MIVTIEVTADDILHGRHYGCFTCPVALAFRRVIRPPFSAKVRSIVRIGPFDETTKLLSDLCDEDEWSLYLPDDVYRWILDFDDGNHPGPFAFRVDIPDRFLKFAA